MTPQENELRQAKEALARVEQRLKSGDCCDLEEHQLHQRKHRLKKRIKTLSAGALQGDRT